MEPMNLELLKALLSLGVAVTTLALGWFVGQRLTMRWNLRQKQREFDLSAANDFHRLYGEFFAVWKLWNYSLDAQQDNTITCSELLIRASAAEGGIESLLVRISANRELSRDDIRALASFRQGYQNLREAIRDTHKLDWGSSSHPEYLAFKRLATYVALLITSDTSPTAETSKSRADALISITSNEWENNWSE
jgi:hypothetical protein